ncbi:MAG: tripartite tricarboxylate transporter substrate binding protein [Alphaproteobacteria bacterium]|nr:tripartite tricarboxylate transporter substrate binding protein [Alphaproteobacteria bacterium]
MDFKTIRFLTAAAVGLVLLVQPAFSQTYPSKPIHILVPYAPGGIADIASRIVGAKLTEAWGQQVVVENKPGGNAFIGMTAGAKAPADGYTLTMATVGDVAINPALFKDIPYKWDDYAPISTISDAPMVWAANAATPYRSIADVLAAAKAQPGRLSVGTPGNGSINQVVMEWMALNTGIQFQHIPYKGGAPAAAALAGGDIPFGVLASSSAAPQVKAGRLRVLAVTGAQPSKFNPEWPTLQSQGVKDVDASNWTLLLAPKGTPKEIVDKLQAEVAKILAMPDVKERFAGGGVETIPSTGAELDAKVKKTAQQLSVIVEKAKIKAD